jgi:O-acetyl-ADP-ribose deacetylase (regulator of RNase III)
MIRYIEGNLFESEAQTLVNTVNTVGVMGAGIAKQFKDIFPTMYKDYKELCDLKKLQVGRLHLYKTPNKWILNFPTKIHWQNPSKKEYIEQGLSTFANNYEKFGIESAAFPPLGCGLGGLDFDLFVKPLIEWKLKRLPIDIFVYVRAGHQERAGNLSVSSELANALRNGSNRKMCESILIR